MSYRKINGLSVADEDKVSLPNGEVIVLADYGVVPSWYTQGDLHFCNHNNFRLDKDGNVVWQVQRDDRGRIRWDRIMARVAKGDFENSRKPFTYLSQTFVRRGKFNDSNDVETPLLETDESPIWQPGFVIIASAGGEHYELDVETGWAVNVSTWIGREW